MSIEDSDRGLGRLLRQLTVETDRLAEVFGETHGMHRTDLNALVVIMDSSRRGEPISPTQLARALHLSISIIESHGVCAPVYRRFEAARRAQRRAHLGSTCRRPADNRDG
jgi:hypothetical protein